MKLKNLKWHPGVDNDKVWFADLNDWSFRVEQSAGENSWVGYIWPNFTSPKCFPTAAEAKAWCVQEWWFIRSRTLPNMKRRIRDMPFINYGLRQ